MIGFWDFCLLPWLDMFLRIFYYLRIYVSDLDMFLRILFIDHFCVIPWYVFEGASWPVANLEQRSQLSGTDLYVSTCGKTSDELQSQWGPLLSKRTWLNEIQRVSHRNSDWQKLCFSYSVLKMRRVTHRLVQKKMVNLFIWTWFQSYWRQMNEIVSHRKVWPPCEVCVKEVWLVEQRKKQFGEIWKTDK